MLANSTCNTSTLQLLVQLQGKNMLVVVGRLGRPHATRGQLRLWPGAGSSLAWLDAERLFVGKDRDSARPFRLLRASRTEKFIIVKLQGIDSIEQAAALVNLECYVEREQLPECEEGCYYVADLLGLRVEDRQGRVLGRLKEIFDGGAHEVYVVDDGRRSVLLPVVDGVVVEVDCRAGRMVVDPPPGLPGLEE